ncbi:replication-relaxation family protein [Niallia endozanthoxylica]|uniref:Uncharacterized protein n=1 Tax=Niallia endozanthoxylica TaxID=2036016 RepID=A0A5J5HHV0_9BACI|nr:replication-relaxation family protein [Niallia endozanthoxylica]KAA9019022.1 hypothetical protein F4V44_19795 [Niallia endozanthoxylica]
MMEEGNFDGLIVSEKEFKVLKDLYNYRSLTTEQIKRKYFSDSKYYVDRALYRLRSRKIITSSVFKGSRGKGKKGHTVHRLTETGLECLTRHGMSVEVQQPVQLYVRPTQIHYLTMANDVMVDLTLAGWEVWDSRKVKREYNLDRQMNIAGLLINPEGKRFGYYVLDSAATIQLLGKIQAEIKDNYPRIKNFIIFTKGQRSYEQFMEYSFNPPNKRVANRLIEQKPIYTGYDLKVVSSRTGRRLLQKYPSKSEWIHALSNHLGFEVINETIQEDETRQSFPTVVKYKDEEMYFVDLLDSDITQIRHIQNYSNQSYQWEKRKLLVTNYSFLKEYQRIEDNPFLIEKLDMNLSDIAELLFPETIQ